MKHFHPRKNNKGQPVELFHPSQATNLAAWGQAEELATVAPQGPGKLDKENGLSLRANALNEVFEESGLKVQLTGFLCDSVRTTSVTRFYLAMRVGGNPADMGWESQAAHLLPMDQLPAFVSHDSDKIVVQSLRALPRLSKSDIVSYQWGLTSVSVAVEKRLKMAVERGFG